MTIAPTAIVEPSAGPKASWIATGSLAVGAFALVTSEFLPVLLPPAIASDGGSTSGETGLMVTLPAITAQSRHRSRSIMVARSSASLGAMLFGGLASLTTLVLAMLHQRSRKLSTLEQRR